MVDVSDSISLLSVGSESAARTITDHGDDRFAVETVPDAGAALDRLRSGGTDCVVAGPEADGIDLVRTIRAEHPTVPFVFLTATDASGIAEAAIEAGATDVVRTGTGPEPIPYAVFTNRIENAVRGHRTDRVPSPEDLPVGVYRSVLEPDGQIVAANGAFASLFEADSTEELLGTAAVDLYRDPTDRARLRERLESGDVVRDMEILAETLEGDPIWVSIAAARTGDGRSCADVVVRDIASRKERETELSMFRQAVEYAGHSVYFTDRNGRIEYVNEAFGETTGYTDEEAVGQTPRILKSGEHDREFYEALWETILSGEVWRDEIVNTTKVGDRYVADQTIAPVEGPGGEIERFVAINIDITDRKERERTLERFRSAVEHAGHGVLITDTGGRIEYVNEAFSEISGYSAAEAVGRTPSMLKSGKHDGEFYRRLWKTIRSGQSWHGEVTNEDKSGSRYVVDQTIAPITDAVGEVTGFVAINRDITELKTYERKLEAQNDRLKQYGHSVAHDLRNPLTLLKAEIDDFSAVADEESIDAETVRRRSEELRKIVDRMESLIDDLLTMAEQGQQVLDAEPVALGAVADAAWKQIEIEQADLTVEDATIDADPDRLRELLSNLFRNAIEHAGENVSVRVSPLDFVEGFFVEDDGPGISPEEREQVLDRGYTTDEDGTGFGLAIVEQIAAAHDWTVVVSEGRDGGARFEFRPETE